LRSHTCKPENKNSQNNSRICSKGIQAGVGSKFSLPFILESIPKNKLEPISASGDQTSQTICKELSHRQPNCRMQRCKGRPAFASLRQGGKN
jgi:hypothetical protein